MKTIIILISTLFCISYLSAQTRYYDITKTFKENDYTYQCDVLKGAAFVTLYNEESKFVHVEQIDKTTGKKMYLDYKKPQVQDDSWTRDKCFSIVDSAFSKAEKQRIQGKDQPLTVLLYIDSSTGRVSDVVFNFVSFAPYGTIPVEVYHKIEVEIKKSMWFTPTQEGKKWNYICCWYRITPQ